MVKPWHQYKSAISLVAGALLPIFLITPYLGILATLSLMGLFHGWQDATPKQAAWRGGLFGLGMFGIGVSWVYVAFNQFGGMHPFISGLMTIFSVVFLASILAGLGWLLKRFLPNPLSTIDTLIILPLAWLGFEWFKTWFLTGFPWLEVGIGQVDTFFLQGLIPVVGSQGVSFLIAMAAAVIINVGQEKGTKAHAPVIIFMGLLPSIALLAYFDTTNFPSDSDIQRRGQPNILEVAIIQANIPQSLKWDPDQAGKTLALYRDLTRENWDADLIVWPENALPIFYHQALDSYLDPLAEEARATHTDIILGLPVQEPGTQHYYNAAVTLGSERNFYHKQRLVPFGEYLPLASMLKGIIAFFDLPMSGFVPGETGQPLLTVAGQPVGVSICYDDAYPSVIRETVPEATMLINMSNNAWYGNSLAPHQHLQIARARALEVGRPIIRSTTNGISALIDHRGNVLAQTPQFEQAVLRGKVELRQGSTVYVTYGRWVLWSMIALMLSIWFVARKREQHV